MAEREVMTQWNITYTTERNGYDRQVATPLLFEVPCQVQFIFPCGHQRYQNKKWNHKIFKAKKLLRDKHEYQEMSKAIYLSNDESYIHMSRNMYQIMI